MINVSDVYTVLRSYETTKDYTGDELFPCCERGLSWVMTRLKDDADKDDPLITQTAAAIAEFYLFIRRIKDVDLYESYKAGDMTVKRNPEKEMNLAIKRRAMAISEASSILKDGGFYCCGK